MTNMGTNTSNSRTINRQEQQQDQEQPQEHQKQYKAVGHYHDYNYYYPAHVRAHARTREELARHMAMRDTIVEETNKRAAFVDYGSNELPPDEIMATIKQAYHDNISPMITKAAAGIIERALRHGMEPQHVIMAIEETGMAARPSPYYLSAVLRNWAENGIVTSKARPESWLEPTEARQWWR